MKVKDLIEELQQADPEQEVYLQTDPEGNGYYVVRGADIDAIVTSLDAYKTPESVFSSGWTADECCLEEDEWEELKAGPRSVIVFP